MGPLTPPDSAVPGFPSRVKWKVSVKKIIFWGDGILSGPSGYGELLENHVFLHHPRAAVSMSIQGRDGSTLAEALREAPLHAIGKDPDLLYLGFGHSDIAAGRTQGEIGRAFQDLIGLVLQKTRTRICLSGLIPGFFSEDEERLRCHAVNRTLLSLGGSPGGPVGPGSRVAFLDLESKVEDFLREHRESPGDQRALHLDPSRLTPLGQLFLAHQAYSLAPWPDFQVGPALASAQA